MSPGPAKRRWFRFSLRTLFVVMTIVSLWFGYQFNWIHRRHEFLADQQSALEHRIGTIQEGGTLVDKYRKVRAPGVLAYFGEAGYEGIFVVVKCESADDINAQDYQNVLQARRLFPEAIIGVIGRSKSGLWQRRASEIVMRPPRD